MLLIGCIYQIAQIFLKENKWVNPKTGQTNINLTPVVTQKGIDYIIKLLLKSGYVANDR